MFEELAAAPPAPAPTECPDSVTSMPCKVCNKPFGSDEMYVLPCGHFVHNTCRDGFKDLSCPFACPTVETMELELSMKLPAATVEEDFRAIDCRICWEPIGNKPAHALGCGHVFHAECINQYKETRKLDWSACCIYKCNRTVINVEAATSIGSQVTSTSATTSSTSSTDGLGTDDA